MSAQKWAILLLVMTLLLTSVCAVANAQSTKKTNVVQIIAPPKNGSAGPTQSVNGKAQLLSGYKLWIMPYDPITATYYPQGSVTVRSDAKWSTRLSVGSIFSVGKVFQIHAVAANPSASNTLNNYASQRTGIAKLPAGAQAVDAVTVTRVAADAPNTPSVSPSPTAGSQTASAVSSNATAEVRPSTTTVSSGGASSNPLPGFEAFYALGALATIVVVLRWAWRR